MQARKTTHALDGQHQNVDRTPRGRASQKDRGQRQYKWRKYIHGVANRRIEDGQRTEQNELKLFFSGPPCSHQKISVAAMIVSL